MISRRYLSLTIFAYLFLVFLAIYSYQVAPLSDDLSMIAYSRSWSWDWFNKGLADYFIVYPEFYSPQSNFIRPVSNIVYWIFNTLLPFRNPFLANQIQLLIVTYGMLAAFSLLMYALIRRVNTSIFVAVAGTISSFIIPTFWTTPTTTYTSFVFDGLAATFCLLALIAYDKKRIVYMATCLSLAIMTKEITFPILIGFGIAFLILRDIRALIGCGTAAAIFILLRLHGFGLHAEGVYVFRADEIILTHVVLNLLRNIFTLPFGVVFYDEIFLPDGLNLLNRSAALLAINLCVYIMVGIIIGRFAIYAIREQRRLKDNVKAFFDRDRAIILIAAVAAFISFLSDVYVGANYRYAFNFLPFLFIAIAGARLPTLARNIVFVLFIAGSVLGSGPAIARLYNNFEFEKFRYQAVRDLFQVLQTHESARSIVILNDFVLGYANPEAIEILLQKKIEILRGTSLYLDGCDMHELSKISTRIETSNAETKTAVTLPECGRFNFESAPKLATFVSGNKIGRNERIEYEFAFNPDRSYLSVSGWTGRDLTIKTRELDILYFDFADRTWKFMR